MVNCIVRDVLLVTWRCKTPFLTLLFTGRTPRKEIYCAQLNNSREAAGQEFKLCVESNQNFFSLLAKCARSTTFINCVNAIATFRDSVSLFQTIC